MLNIRRTNKEELIEGCVQGWSHHEVHGHKIVWSHINENFHLPFKKKGKKNFYHFNAKINFSVTLWAFQTLIYSVAVSPFFTISWQRMIEMTLSVSDEGVGKTMKGRSPGVACLTFTQPFSYWTTTEYG